jgi:phosphoserine phosphatase
MKEKDLIIFDIDRTIYDGSIGQDFIIELVNERIISPKILASLSFELLEYELDLQNYNKTVSDALKLLANELINKDASYVKEVARRVIEYNHYKFYDYIFEIPKLYKDFDYILLSLEPDILVKEISDYLQIPNFVANSFLDKNKNLTNSNKILTNKIEMLENSNFKNRNICTAFGDSENDFGILQKARLKIVINPTPNLQKKITNSNDFIVTNSKLVYEDFKKHIINFI